jgi:hypothetical protein
MANARTALTVSAAAGVVSLRRAAAVRRCRCQRNRPSPLPFSASVALRPNFARLRYAASLWRAASLIIAAPFSAIMIVGPLVLVEVTAGIAEASMTLSLSSVHPLSVVDDAQRVLAHQAGAAGAKAGAAVAPRAVGQFVVALDLGAGEGLFVEEALEGRGVEQPARKAQPADDRARVLSSFPPKDSAS